MNQCFFCGEKFSYWEVWKAFWRGWYIKCKKCAKYNQFQTTTKIYLGSLILLIPGGITLILHKLFPDLVSGYGIGTLIFSILYIGLSFFIPLLKVFK
ncbi:MAG: hypothetical protein D6813_10160 [Calditrichaeota bacterium]|nr:MAG: hypothetical protein D6813_10160 [Calditrichota bacterium]